MKIVLAEDRSGKLFGERTFTADVIIVGRDPAVCHYYVSQDQWPMVSRKHAEFRLGEGRCLVADTNSRFGTFVEGQRVDAPVEVRVGSHVQLGGGGPILRVVSIEQTAAAKISPPPSELGRMDTVREQQSAKATPQANESGLRTQKIRETPPSPPQLKLQSALLLLTPDGREAKRIELSKEVTRPGSRGRSRNRRGGGRGLSPSC